VLASSLNEIEINFFMQDNDYLDSLQLEAIVFDFDGVLTDNRVFVDQDGREMVCCHRGDGLAFDVLKRTHLQLFILSTETNPVVTSRGQKLRVPVYQSTKDKKSSLEKLALGGNFSLEKTLFVGNDLNDYDAMQICGFSACPSDSHPKILEIATFTLNKKGGGGVVREIVEQTLQIDVLRML
jgi:3-deoxy-D-manno-octulosonate 8-phosphate phosphatase (KDO 8-P phosphatase)